MFSDIKVYPLKKDHPTIKANGSVVVANALAVNFKVLKGKEGLFVSLPSHQDPTSKKWFDDVRCISKEVRQQLNTEILAAYDKYAGGSSAKPAETQSSGDDLPF